MSCMTIVGHGPILTCGWKRTVSYGPGPCLVGCRTNPGRIALLSPCPIMTSTTLSTRTSTRPSRTSDGGRNTTARRDGSSSPCTVAATMCGTSSSTPAPTGSSGGRTTRTRRTRPRRSARSMRRPTDAATVTRRPRQAQRVHGDVPLASVDLLARVVASEWGRARSGRRAPTGSRSRIAGFDTAPAASVGTRSPGSGAPGWLAGLGACSSTQGIVVFER